MRKRSVDRETQLHNAERICLLLAAFPPEVCRRVLMDLSSADRALLNDTAQRLTQRPTGERRRMLLEALQHPRLAAILAKGEVERLNQLHPVPEPQPRFREKLMEWLDPRIWFRFRKS